MVVNRVAKQLVTLPFTKTCVVAANAAVGHETSRICTSSLVTRKISTQLQQRSVRGFGSSAKTYSKAAVSQSKNSNANESILTLSCPDQPGIVHAVTGFLKANSLNILDSQQFGDPSSKKFFMRVHSAATAGDLNIDQLRTAFQTQADKLDMSFELHSMAKKPRVLVMVSKDGNTLIDLLFKQSVDQLPIEIPLIISNHPTFATLAASYNIPFFHLPVTAATKAEQERKIMDLVDEHQIDLVVLARYMQILPPSMCQKLSGRIINIHHSFLPSFKGAKPYHQAYDRGVKIIGATAHYVTADLDEGPIIEQNVVRVDHGFSAKELTIEGSNVERTVLSSAVKWVAERRVLLNGHKTIVFR